MAGGHEESSVTAWRWETRGSHLHIPGGFLPLGVFSLILRFNSKMEYVSLEKVGSLKAKSCGCFYWLELSPGFVKVMDHPKMKTLMSCVCFTAKSGGKRYFEVRRLQHLTSIKWIQNHSWEISQKVILTMSTLPWKNVFYQRFVL